MVVDLLLFRLRKCYGSYLIPDQAHPFTIPVSLLVHNEAAKGKVKTEFNISLQKATDYSVEFWNLIEMFLRNISKLDKFARFTISVRDKDHYNLSVSSVKDIRRESPEFLLFSQMIQGAFGNVSEFEQLPGTLGNSRIFVAFQIKVSPQFCLRNDAVESEKFSTMEGLGQFLSDFFGSDFPFYISRDITNPIPSPEIFVKFKIDQLLTIDDITGLINGLFFEESGEHQWDDFLCELEVSQQQKTSTILCLRFVYVPEEFEASVKAFYKSSVLGQLRRILQPKVNSSSAEKPRGKQSKKTPKNFKRKKRHYQQGSVSRQIPSALPTVSEESIAASSAETRVEPRSDKQSTPAPTFEQFPESDFIEMTDEERIELERFARFLELEAKSLKDLIDFK